MRNGKIFYK